MSQPRHLHRLVILCLLVLALVSACGPNGVNPPNNENIIGPAGGTVTSQDGDVTLEIPAGALNSDTEITITAASSATLPAIPTGVELVPGTAYTIEADEVSSFAKPVELSVSFDSSTLDRQAGLGVQQNLPIRYVVAIATTQGWSPLSGCTYSAEPSEKIRCAISRVGTFAVLQVATTPGATLSVNVTSINGQAPGGTVTVMGEFPITVEVQAGSAPVTKVELLTAGVPVYSYPLPEPIPANTLRSIEVPVNTSQIPNGTYSLTLRVTDSAGKTASSSPISVTVNNPAPTQAALEIVGIDGKPLSEYSQPIPVTSVGGNATVTFNLQVTTGASSICRVAIAGSGSSHFDDDGNFTGGITDAPVRFDDGMCVPAGTTEVKDFTFNIRLYSTGTVYFVFGTNSDLKMGIVTKNEVAFNIQ